MIVNSPVRIITGLVLILLFGCGYFYPTNVRLEYGAEWKIPGKRDFRLDAGFYALPERETIEDTQQSLRTLLRAEIKKEGLCPHGYAVTGYGGYEGGGYLYIEGLCKDENANEVPEQE